MIDDGLLHATLSAPPMTDQEFAELCARHPDLFFETTGEGDLIVMPPPYSLTGVRNSRIVRQLSGCGMDAEDPHCATGPRQPSGTLAPVSGLVIELQSTTDRPRLVREKMQEWLASGAQLAWLIDPERKSVAIYRGESLVETRTGVDSAAGEGPVGGFSLELGFVWNPLGD